MMPKWIETEDGSQTLFDERIKETYHSREGAWSECQAVFFRPFFEQSILAKKPVWRVLDVGFGLGLNWLCYVNAFLHRSEPAMMALQEKPVLCHDLKLNIYSLEKDVDLLKVEILPQRLGSSPIYQKAFDLLHKIKKQTAIDENGISAQIILGDAKDSLHNLDKNVYFDVILQDPFSPQKNPECWDEDYFRLLVLHCHEGTTLVTYSVASNVRKILDKVGFDVRKLPGLGRKREQLVAFFRG